MFIPPPFLKVYYMFCRLVGRYCSCPADQLITVTSYFNIDKSFSANKHLTLYVEKITALFYYSTISYYTNYSHFPKFSYYRFMCAEVANTPEIKMSEVQFEYTMRGCE